MPRGRKPTDRQLLDGMTPRGRIWREIRALPRFSIDDLARRARCEAALVQSYCYALQAAGFIARERDEPADRREDGSFARVVYHLVRDCGVQAPRLHADGSASSAGATQQGMWTAMRILGSFSWRDVAKALADGEVAAKDGGVKSYVLQLARAGYCDQVCPARSGVAARWRLRLNTGPKAPLVQRTKRIWDANQGRVVWERSEALDRLDEPGLVPARIDEADRGGEPAGDVAGERARGGSHIRSEAELADALQQAPAGPLVRPREEPRHLNHLQAARALVRRGVRMSTRKMAWLVDEFPHGVPEERLDAVAVRAHELGPRDEGKVHEVQARQENDRCNESVAGGGSDRLARAAHARPRAESVA